MKKILGYFGSYFFYYLGDLISKPMMWLDLEFLYPVYKKCMHISLDIQDWAHLEKPWKEPSENDYEKN